MAHVAAGVLGLLVGPAAALSATRRRWHPVVGWAYQSCVVVLCTTTLLLVVLDPALWGFVPIAVGTQVAAAGAVIVRRQRRPGWIPLHAGLSLGSYVSFVTAFVVQTAGGWWWVIPVAVGSAGTAVIVGRLKEGYRQQQRVKAPA